MFQVLQRAGSADFEQNEGIPLRRRPQRADSHAIRQASYFFEILDDLVVARELLVGPDLEAEELLGGGDRLRTRQPSGERCKRKQGGAIVFHGVAANPSTIMNLSGLCQAVLIRWGM